LAVDLIKAIQEWHINGDNVPDPRDAPLQAETDKVKVVAKLEQEQTGVARDLTGNAEGDTPVVKPAEIERPETNGFHSDTTL